VQRDLIPRYQLQETLGESFRATVYLALSEALDHQVALKVGHATDGEEALFSREFQLIGGLRHPAVIDIYDCGVYAGREYMAMEYFPGGDLRARLLDPICENQAVDYMLLIAAALSAVHVHGIVHRDLKPLNIMLRDDGQIVLIDFGISMPIGQNTHDTAVGVLRGSPYYMSPEQARGLALDARSDIYSLGVIFYEMLTGKRPYLGVTAVEILQQHVSAPVPQLPAGLVHHQPLLDGMMAKARQRRFASVDALLANLSRSE
jgi:serine/threonine protein kinase